MTPRLRLAALLLAAIVPAVLPAGAADRTLTVGANAMTVEVFRARTPKPAGVALVLHTSHGLDAADIECAQKLASAGFTAAVPHFLSAYGISPKQRQDTWSRYFDGIYGDLKAIVATVAAEEKLSPARSFAIGFSNGGYWAAYLAAKGDVARAVSFYGAYSQAGLDKSLDSFRAAFSTRSAPLLVFHGTNDDTVPVIAAEKLRAIGEAAHAPVTLVLLDGAGHRFDRSGNSPAAAATWQQALDFLRK